MKLYILFIIIFFGLLGCTNYSLQHYPSISLYPGTLLVVQQTNNGIEPKCSGTLIQKDLVLTAAHCISKYNKIMYACTYINDSNCLSVSIIKTKINNDIDIALLFLEKDISQHMSWANLGSISPKEGQPLTISGFGSYGEYKTIRMNIYVKGGHYIRASNKYDKIMPGDSGAGVYDDYYNLIGIVSQKTTQYDLLDNLNLWDGATIVDITYYLGWINKSYTDFLILKREHLL